MCSRLTLLIVKPIEHELLHFSISPFAFDYLNLYITVSY